MVKEVSLTKSEISRVEGTKDLRTTTHKVDADEFFRLMLSNRKILRDDGREFGCRALLDPATGDRFVIEEHKLYEFPQRD